MNETNDTNKSLYTKLNLLIDAELDKDISEMDTDLISECVDGILRMKTEESYQLAKVYILIHSSIFGTNPQ